MKYFVYYSLSGNGDLLADLLKEYGYTPVKVEPVKLLKKPNFFTIIKYGGDAMAAKRRKIHDLDVSISEDDEVIIGSPIWNDRLSTPINAVLADYNLNKETTGFILYPAGEGTSKSLKQLEKLGFKKQPVVIQNPKKYTDKAKELLKPFKE